MRHGSTIGATLSATAAALALLLMLTAAKAADDVVETNTQPDLAEAQARYQTVPREYRLDGVVEAINRTTVSAQTQGQVEEIFYDVDDFVNKGDVLARLRDTEHRTRVAQAAADLKSATAQLKQARDEFGRVEGLYKKKNVSDSAMDKARADLTSAQAHLEAAQAGLHQAQEQLQYTQIRAPYSGIVTQRHVEVGEIASPGQAVMSGISLEELRVIIDVPQSVIPAVRELGEINVYLPNGEVAKPGRITVFPFADLGSNTFKVRVDLTERTEGLFPGMFVKTGIITGKKEELTVPKAAVVYRSEVTGVYVLGEDGDIRLRQIRVGRALGDDLVVLSGLTEGERVALDPIAAGVALKARAQARVAAGGRSDD
jgi:RND family efflux transporter MFP subunit